MSFNCSGQNYFCENYVRYYIQLLSAMWYIQWASNGRQLDPDTEGKHVSVLRLREHYRYMSGPGRHRTVSQHLLLRVQQVFPDVTGDTIHNFVMAAFPGCTKFINKKNGLAFYQGLVTRPDVSCDYMYSILHCSPVILTSGKIDYSR